MVSQDTCPFCTLTEATYECLSVDYFKALTYRRNKKKNTLGSMYLMYKVKKKKVFRKKETVAQQ